MDDLERAVAEVWAGLLDVAEVGADDDFVALGGHSLTAMRVSARLRERGVDVSPRDVLRHRTVRALATAARAGGAASAAAGAAAATGIAGAGGAAGDSGAGAAAPGSGAAAGGPADVSAPDSTVDGRGGDGGTLVWLRAGEGRPWFLLHPGGGGVHWYRELADALPADRPVAAVQHPALADPGLAGSTVEQLADRYLADLRAAAPSGPYRLLGWCGGAPVTWELARRLTAAGEQVLTCLLDPALEGLAGPGNPPPQLAVLRRCEQVFAELRDRTDPDRTDPDRTDPDPDRTDPDPDRTDPDPDPDRTDPDRAAALRAELVGLLHVVVDDERAHPLIGTDPDPGWLEPVRTWRQLAESRLAYRFAPYPGRVELVLGDELVDGGHVSRADRAYEDYLDRWRGSATGGLRVHRVPGSHTGVLRPPAVGRLADLLESISAEEER